MSGGILPRFFEHADELEAALVSLEDQIAYLSNWWLVFVHEFRDCGFDAGQVVHEPQFPETLH